MLLRLKKLKDLRKGEYVFVMGLGNKTVSVEKMGTENILKDILLVKPRNGIFLYFQKIEPSHNNEVLFHLPWVSENVEIWVSQNSIMKCKIKGV